MSVHPSIRLALTRLGPVGPRPGGLGVWAWDGRPGPRGLGQGAWAERLGPRGLGRGAWAKRPGLGKVTADHILSVDHWFLMLYIFI